MIYLFLLGGLFLGWSFGRNNLSNVFGTAIGTRMIPFKLAALLAGVFIMLGAIFSSGATTERMLALGQVDSAFGAFLISLSVGITILCASKFGMPVSMAQGVVGALVGWNIFLQIENNWSLLGRMIGAWFYSPFLAALFAVLGFYVMRFLLHHVRIPILYRDFWVRILLVFSGIYSSYFLGANNIAAIASPYLGTQMYSPLLVIGLITIAVAIGAQMADKRVIETVSSGLFPLSPLEALVVVLSCGMTLYCFSDNGLRLVLDELNLPTLPLVPVPTSSILVGSIIGVGLAKGHLGIRWNVLSKIFVSWVAVPVISGLICYAILAILMLGRGIL